MREFEYFDWGGLERCASLSILVGLYLFPSLSGLDDPPVPEDTDQSLPERRVSDNLSTRGWGSSVGVMPCLSDWIGGMKIGTVETDVFLGFTGLSSC